MECVLVVSSLCSGDARPLVEGQRSLALSSHPPSAPSHGAQPGSLSPSPLPHPHRVSIPTTLTNSLPPVFFTGKQEGRKEGEEVFSEPLVFIRRFAFSFFSLSRTPNLIVPEGGNLIHVYL